MAQNSVVSLNCASSPEEIRLLQRRLKYRRKLLDALLSETERELKIILNVDELNDENNPMVNYPDTDLPLLINQLSQSFIDFMRADFTKAKNLEEKQNIGEQLCYQSSILRNLLRHIELQIASAAETLESMEVSSQAEKIEQPQYRVS